MSVGFFVMFYLYILHSASSDKYYIGHSDNPWRRLVEHNEDDKNLLRPNIALGNWSEYFRAVKPER